MKRLNTWINNNPINIKTIINNKEYYFSENKYMKCIKSEDYNFTFDKINGKMMRWGKNKNEDSLYSPIGAEILDLEISSSIIDTKSEVIKNRLINDGGCKGKCPQCYKKNGNYPTYNMTFEEFKRIFHNIANTKVYDPLQNIEYNWNDIYNISLYEMKSLKDGLIVYNKSPLTQIAFGIMNIDTNPDFFKMAEYCNKFGVTPNFTMHGLDNIDDKTLYYIKETFGACAISVYDKNKSYNLLERLNRIGMKQVNFHICYYEENYDFVKSILEDYKTDFRLKNINAFVLLGLKQKGGGINFNKLNDNKFNNLIKYVFDNDIPIGFDSCSANKFINSIKQFKKGEELNNLIEMVEPCEVNCFSSYVNCYGRYFPCSFMEESHKDWMNGIDVINCEDFINNVWLNNKCSEFRNKLYKNNRSCPVFKV